MSNRKTNAAKRYDRERRRRREAEERRETGQAEALPPVALASVDLLRRTGSSAFELRYSKEGDRVVVWIAIGTWRQDDRDAHETAAALDPTRAILRLCERVIDGGVCQHCNKPAGFEPDSLDTMPAVEAICWYQYDPELKVIRRGCEGEQSS